MKHLILLHGALGHPGYFDFIRQSLSDRFEIHAPVFYGHAGCPLPDTSPTMDSYINQLQEYCTSNGLEQVSLFGYSMGGYVALCFAARFPERVSKLMTLATKLDWSPEIARKETAFLNPDTIREKVPKFAAALSAIHGPENWEQLIRVTAQLLTKLGASPLLDASSFERIIAPVQLMIGDKDNMVSIDETREAYIRMKGATFAVLPDTIHPFEKINRLLLLRLMEDFFSDVRQITLIS